MENYLPREVHVEFEKRMEAEHDRQNHRLTGLEKNVENLTSIANSVQSLAESVARMTKEQEKQGARLEALEKKPAKRWDNLVDKIVWAVSAAVIAFLLAQIGL